MCKNLCLENQEQKKKIIKQLEYLHIQINKFRYSLKNTSFLSLNIEPARSSKLSTAESIHLSRDIPLRRWKWDDCYPLVWINSGKPSENDR